MSDGKTHMRYSRGFSLLLTISLILLIFRLNLQPYFIPFFVALLLGSIIAWYLNPDADLIQITVGESSLRRISRPLAKLINSCFASYAIWHQHRGISHVFVIGSLERMLWLFTNLFTAVGVSGILAVLFYISIEYAIMIVLGIILGWVLQDGVHLVLDTKFFKRWSSAKARRRRKFILVTFLLITIASYAYYMYVNS